MSTSEQQSCIELDTNTYDSDDSNEDQTFDVLEETRSRFSRLSIKKKSKPGIAKEDEDLEDGEYAVQVVLPELDEQDQKSYEIVEKIIKAGQAGKLKVDQCKVYLRKHGLRLTGKKDTLIQRIKEHLEIIDGGGERKYPASSFVMNCRGDACTGDIVLFEQNVYEMFSVASRSATGPPCGTRIVAGRIEKESYGAAKQQHTFTIEVLWSKGEKPLPPLHPLLIKGRNLYRLKTLRQKWEDEGERQKILLEKHARGAVARSNRDARVQKRETRMMRKPDRASRTNDQYGEQENRREWSHCPSNTSEKAIDNPQKQQEDLVPWQPGHDLKQTSYLSNNHSSLVPPKALQHKPVFTNTLNHLRQPLSNISKESSTIPFRQHDDSQCINAMTSTQRGTVYPNHLKPMQRPSYHGNAMSSPQRGTTYPNHLKPIGRPSYHGNAMSSPQRGTTYPNHLKPIGRPSYHDNANFTTVGSPVRPTYPSHLKPIQMPSYQGNANFITIGSPVRGQQHHGQKKTCRFYAQGRCYYGDSCKYLHDYSENHYSR